jgi:hypothetical protein
MKFSVKKNRTFRQKNFAKEDTSNCVGDHELLPGKVSGALKFLEASARMPSTSRKTYPSASMKGSCHAQ